MEHLEDTPNLLIVDFGGMAISTARGRLMPKVTSPVYGAATFFYSCLVDNYHLSCTISKF
jgi:hypothetical protein